MKNNIFLSALKPSTLRPGLESNDNPATVEVEDVHHVDPMMPKKAGFTECKEGDEHPKTDKVIGDEPDFGSKDEDWVAESQVHTVALESISATMRRYTRMACALESIADTIDEQLEAGTPISPVTAAMVTTAIDAGEVGATPLEEEVALESFGMDLNVATEAFAEKLREKASAVMNAWSRAWAATIKVFRKRWNKMVGDYATLVDVIHEDLEKYTQLDNVGGKPMGDLKWLGKIHCAQSDKTPAEAMEGSLAAFRDVRDFMARELNNGDFDTQKEVSGADGGKVIGMDRAYALVDDLQNSIDKIAKKLENYQDYRGVRIAVKYPKKDFADGNPGAEGFDVSISAKSPTGLPRVQKTATKRDVEFILRTTRDVQAELTKVMDIIGDWNGTELDDGKGAGVLTELRKSSSGFHGSVGEVIGRAAAAATIGAVKGVVERRRDNKAAADNQFPDRQTFVAARTLVNNLCVVLKDSVIHALAEHHDNLQANTKACIRWIEDSMRVEKAAAKSDPKGE